MYLRRGMGIRHVQNQDPTLQGWPAYYVPIFVFLVSKNSYNSELCNFQALVFAQFFGGPLQCPQGLDFSSDKISTIHGYLAHV